MNSITRLSVFACLLVFATGCSVLPENKDGDSELAVSEDQYDEGQADSVNVCGVQETYDTLNNMVFDEVIDQLDGDPVNLNDLRRSVSVNMKFPVVTELHEELERTDCSGRLVLGIPPTARKAFDGESELAADIEYSVQPSADGNGFVIRATGLDFLVNRIASAESLRKARRIASNGGPQLKKTYNPSFDCGAGLDNTERMICQDEDLSAMDRRLSQAFKQKLANYEGSSRQALLQRQRRLLTVRGNCADTACLYDWYENELDRYYRSSGDAAEMAADAAEAAAEAAEAAVEDDY
jgi:uncharacterized protein YecT (DUF1311 family)